MTIQGKSKPIDRLLDIMAQLRDKKSGCPWDIEQNFASIVPHTIEEAYEVADAIEKNDMNGLREELGDLLLQVVFHAQMAAELQLFTFDNVVEAINEKLLRRHPHIFGDKHGTTAITTAAQQSEAWEKLKISEKETLGTHSSRQDVLGGVTAALPGLTRAVKLQKRAARVGFDWSDIGAVFEKLEEEIRELQLVRKQGGDKAAAEEELGDILFCCANIARKLDVDPESAVRLTNRKFENRFHYMQGELDLQRRNIDDASLQELNDLWDQAKIAEKAQNFEK